MRQIYENKTCFLSILLPIDNVFGKDKYMKTFFVKYLKYPTKELIL